jgi:sugar phosphate isomerase/epimerase
MGVTRRTFLEAAMTSASVVAMASGVGSNATAAAVKHKIKRGVATYSYQEEFFVRQMSVEDCLREASDIGAYGIELLAEMMVPDFPNPSDAWVDMWHGWMDRYHTFPACYTQFIDTMRTKSHNLTIEEGVQTMLRDIKLAKRLGIPRIRCLIGTPVPILEATLPYLEDNDIWIGVELHAPITINGPLMARLMKLADKSSRFGFVPDFGIFQNKPNPFARDRLIREGQITRDAALAIENAWENKVDRAKIASDAAKMKGGTGVAGYVQQVYGITTQDARDLLPIMAKCQHIHGKTWGLNEDCTDPAIDLTQVIPILIKGGYDGVIATEYEGQRLVQDIYPFSEVEMIRRHHVMLRRLLD